MTTTKEPEPITEEAKEAVKRLLDPPEGERKGVAIATALLAVQKACPPLALDATNPHFRSSYVSLGGMIETVLPILNEHGVLLTQSPSEGINGTPTLVTRLIHAETGERLVTSTPLYMEKPSAQAHGSAITYARRYALMSMLGLIGDEDDDGEAASRPAREETITQAERRQAAEERREFDPGRDLLPTALRVTTEDDAVAVRQAQWSLAPDENWPAVETYLSESVFGTPYEGLDNPQKREFWTRLANAVVKADSLAGPGGDFPPPTFEQVEEAYAWAFKGTKLALKRPEASAEATGGDLTAEEGEAGTDASPEEAAPEEAGDDTTEDDPAEQDAEPTE